MANEQTEQPEPLNNVELESAALGLRMALDEDEARESRTRFLSILRTSTLAVPTMTPVPIGPDGAMLPNGEINLLVVNTEAGVSGVPAFTSLGGLRSSLPQMENGMFLTGGDLGNILGASEHKLFVDGLDMHVEVESVELQQMAFVTQQIVAAEQAAAHGNIALADALTALGTEDTPANREAVTAAFLQGFCMYVIAAEADSDEEAVVLSQQSPEYGEEPQEVALLTLDGVMPCFSTMTAFQAWDTVGRGAAPIPGQMIVPLATQAEVAHFIIDPGAPTERRLRVEQDRVTVA